MARSKNIGHNAQTLRALANSLRLWASKADEEAEKYEKSGLKGRISVGHQAAIDKGIRAFRKMLHEFGGKVDDGEVMAEE